MGTIVLREGWNARQAKGRNSLLPHEVDAIAIHYSGAAIDEQPDYAARVRAIQNYHMDTKKWLDIAYSWLVSRTGISYEGRGWGIETAATLHNNDHTQAICFLGNDKEGRDDVTDKGRRAISERIFDYEKIKGTVVTEVHVVHPRTGGLAISGHKDFVSTECPGNELYSFISMRGWEVYREKRGYPPHFFNWAAWWLGEGKYLPYGKRNMKVRPKYPRLPVMPIYWAALRRFLKARKK